MTFVARRTSTIAAVLFAATAFVRVHGSVQRGAVTAWRDAAIASFDDAWKTINDSFYDPKFGGVDWGAVRTELRPRVASAKSPDEARRVITDMLSRLHRSHFVLIAGTPTSDALLPATIPIDVRVAGTDLVVTHVEQNSPSSGILYSAGLRAGTTIVAIDDRKVSDWFGMAQGPDERARALDVWRHAQRSIHGMSGSHATLEVREIDGKVRSMTLPRSIEAGEVVTLGNLPSMRVKVDKSSARTPGGRNVGVIAFNVWMTQIDAPVSAAIDSFRKSDGIVIDLRGNPGGLALMLRGMAGHFFKDRVTLGTMQTREASLEITANPRIVTADGRRVDPFGGALAILVDELTGSASECFAGALQSLGRARIFGRPSMGQALPASTRQLPNGDVLMYAIGDFVTGTGRALEGDGVRPDEFVPLDRMTRAALASGRDPVLDAALRWIDTQAARNSPPLALFRPLLLSSGDLHAPDFLPRLGLRLTQ